MRVSTNIIQQLVDFTLPEVDELVERINLQLGGVEQVINLKEKYKDARIVRVVDCRNLDNSDHLHVCLIDDGNSVENITRNEEGYIQVVCGAPNVKRGMWAVWLPPHSTVPATFNDAEPFVLDARALRGVMSQGMLAAADELAIGTDHEGIVSITNEDLREQDELIAGMSFAQAFGLDDIIIDIENKMFTHRPDCFGQLGIAREIAGIYGKQFHSPDWYRLVQHHNDGEAGKQELNVFDDAREKVPRFMAVVLKNIRVVPSPLWLQCRLVALGSKPVNSIVDMTNYIMLITAQPTHAYDYDKLHGKTLGVRMAQEGERAHLLNDKTYTLSADDIVIVDAEGPVGLGGIMGGYESEVSETTRNIVLEVATFDMYTVRKSSMRHGIFTDALTRFNKGQSPLQNQVVMNRLVEAIAAHQSSSVYDLVGPSGDAAILEGGMCRAQSMDITTTFINERLGLELNQQEISVLLKNVEFVVDTTLHETLTVHVPFWRMDIDEREDIVEEVGRLYGFDNIKRQLPTRSIRPAPKNRRYELKRLVRESLSRAGANEILTYSFVHERVLRAASQLPEHAYRLSNALSPDLQYYRLTVLPSLLDKVHANVKAGYDEFMFFEIGKGHSKMSSKDNDKLPHEQTLVDAVYVSKNKKKGAAYYQVQRQLNQLGKDLGITLQYAPIQREQDQPSTAPFDKSRSAIVQTISGEVLGMIGELKRSVIKQFKLPEYAAAWTLDFDVLLAYSAGASKQYQTLSKYPTISQDISLRTDHSLAFTTLYEAVQDVVSAHGEMYITTQLVTIYQPDNQESKTTTFHVEFTSYERTLTDKDVAPIMEEITAHTLEVVSAKRA